MKAVNKTAEQAVRPEAARKQMIPAGL